MKKVFVILGIAISTQFTYSQKSTIYELPYSLFRQGKEMFLDKNYIGATNSLVEFKKISKAEDLNMEADYMIVSSLFFRGDDKAGDSLKEFLEDHAETYHRNDVSFFIGSVHFDKKEWDQSLFWFRQVNVHHLTTDYLDDFVYRNAYAYLRKNKKTEAYNLFKQLVQTSDKYFEPATYYLAYIDFQNGDYDKALRVFNQLKNKSEYKEQASFFIVQGNFIQGDLQQTIAGGTEYLRLYPQGENVKEVYRMLGNSFHRLNNINSSITYYEKYLQLEKNPLREDMYILGNSYYEAGAYQKAIDVFKFAASTNDHLGQVAFMQLGQAYLKTNDTANALMAFDAASRITFDSSVSEAALYNYVLLVNKTSLSVFDQSVTVLQRFLREYPNSRYANEVNDLLASTFLSTKNYEAALSAIKQIPSPSRQVLGAKQLILFRLGTQDFINSDYDSAMRNLNACVNMGNYNPKVRNEAQFWIAEMNYRSGDYTSARNNYVSYISQAAPSDPNYAIAHYNLGYTYFQQKEYANATSSFNKYVNAEKDKSKTTYSDAMNRIGDGYLYSRNFTDAERFYAQAVSVNPSAADYSEFQKAFVLGLQKKYGAKVTALDGMMAKYPNSQYYDDALFEKSRALVMLDREKDAIVPLEKLIQENPQSNIRGKAAVQLAQLYFNTNNSPKSIQTYKQIIADYPNSEDARIAIKSMEGVYKDMNDIGSYADYVNSLGMGTVLTSSRQDSLTYLAAEDIYMKGQKVKAQSAFKQYLQKYPMGIYSGDAHYILGHMAFDNKDMKTALIEFEQVASRSNSKYVEDALIYSSGIYFDQANYELAYATYKRLDNVANTFDNQNIAKLGMLRSAALMKKDQEVVVAATALINNPKTSPKVQTEARYFRAKSYQNLKQVDNAMNDFQILAKDTRDAFGAESQFILADAYYKWKSYDKVEQQVLGFMKQGTPHEYWMAKSLIVLSDSYAAKGDRFQAKQYLESLKANYKGTEADIATAIEDRLKNMK